MNNSQNQLKKLTTRLWAGIFLVFFLLISIASFMYFNHVKALINNYDAKGPGSTLTAAEWGFLDDDFVPQPAGCVAGQVVQWDGANWICANDAVGGSVGITGNFVVEDCAACERCDVVLTSGSVTSWTCASISCDACR